MLQLTFPEWMRFFDVEEESFRNSNVSQFTDDEGRYFSAENGYRGRFLPGPQRNSRMLLTNAMAFSEEYTSQWLDEQLSYDVEDKKNGYVACFAQRRAHKPASLCRPLTRTPHPWCRNLTYPKPEEPEEGDRWLLACKPKYMGDSDLLKEFRAHLALRSGKKGASGGVGRGVRRCMKRYNVRYV